MRILSCPETSKGEFHPQKHVEASYQVTVEQWYISKYFVKELVERIWW